MKLKKTKNREFFGLAIVLTVATVFSIFSISTQFAPRVYELLITYARMPMVQFLFNFVFLSLSGLLLVTYKNWKLASKRKFELENIISSISPDVLLVVNNFGRIILCNGSMMRLFGYNPEEIINRGTTLLYYNKREDPSCSEEFYTTMSENGFHIWLATGRKRNGKTIPLEIISAHLNNGDGDVILIRDITERVRVQKTLRESLQTSKEIVQSIPSGLLIFQYTIDKGFVLVGGNSEAERICNININNSRDKIMDDLWPEAHKKRLSEAYTSVLKTGKPIVADDLYYRQGQLERALNIRVFRIPGKRIGVAFENVTQQKIAEHSREQLIGQLSQALAEIKTLSGLVPICASCKKIRDDDGYWEHVENYIEKHSKAVFSHSLCPECMKKLYPDEVADIDILENNERKQIEMSFSDKIKQILTSKAA